MTATFNKSLKQNQNDLGRCINPYAQMARCGLCLSEVSCICQLVNQCITLTLAVSVVLVDAVWSIWRLFDFPWDADTNPKASLLNMDSFFNL